MSVVHRRNKTNPRREIPAEKRTLILRHVAEFRRLPCLFLSCFLAVMYWYVSARQRQTFGDLFTSASANTKPKSIRTESSNSPSSTVSRFEVDINDAALKNFDQYFAPWSWGLSPEWRIDEEDIYACSHHDTSRESQHVRKPTFPLVTGDGFRCLSDVLLDENTKFTMKIQTQQHANVTEDNSIETFNDGTFTQVVDRKNVSYNPVIFLKSDRDQNGQFFNEYEGNIARPYVLVTHNSDIAIPSKASLEHTDNPNLAHWFGQNKQVDHHDKITAVPIGFQNLRWGPSCSAENYRKAASIALESQKEKAGRTSTEKMLLASFTPRTNSRKKAIAHAEKHSWATVQEMSYDRYQDSEKSKAQDELHLSYLLDVAQYKYAFSPKGNGIDCHRHYELLLLGVIPILEESAINSIFLPPNLPQGAVLIVKDWEEVTLEMLEDHWKAYQPILQRRTAGNGVDPIIPKILTMRYWMDAVWDKARIA